MRKQSFERKQGCTLELQESLSMEEEKRDGVPVYFVACFSRFFFFALQSLSLLLQGGKVFAWTRTWESA